MKRTRLAALIGLGFAGLACGTNEPNVKLLTADGLPLRTAEEQQVADDMEKNTVAEIDLPEGKMKFIEMPPGQVTIMRQIRVGAAVTRVDGESGMTLEQIFRAYAPGKDVPQRLSGAMERVIQLEATQAKTSLETVGGETLFEGTRLERQPDVSLDGTERVTSALASSVDQTWFTNAFCRTTGTNWSWCLSSAWQGAYATRVTHRSNSVTCGDTGAARVSFFVGNTLNRTFDVPYSECWYSGTYHHTHGFLGYNNEITQKYTVPFAEGYVRFAGWNADNDQFISAY